MTDSVTLRPDPQAASRIEFTALRDDGESTLSIVVDADGGWRLSETDECARSGTISTGCLHDLIVGFLSAFGIEDEMTLELTEIRGSWFVRFLMAGVPVSSKSGPILSEAVSIPDARRPAETVLRHAARDLLRPNHLTRDHRPCPKANRPATSTTASKTGFRRSSGSCSPSICRKSAAENGGRPAC